MIDLVRRADRYGETVGFKYRGKNQHQTFMGGFLTLMQASWVIALFFILLYDIKIFLQTIFLGLQNDIQLVGLLESNWACISDFEANIQGQDMSLVQNFLNIKVELCQNRSESGISIPDSESLDCASNEEIMQFVNKVQFMVAFVNKYFDADDFSQSIKSEVNIQFYNPVYGFNQVQQLNLQLNQLNVKDNPFLDILTLKEYEFLKISAQKTTYAAQQPGSQDVFNLYLMCDQQEISIEQSVYTIISIFTIIGGYHNFLTFFFRFLNSTFKRQIFYWDLMNNIFYFHQDASKSKYHQHDRKCQFDKEILKHEIAKRVQDKKYEGMRDVCQFFYLKFKKRASKKYNYYQNGSKKLDKILDIGYIIKIIKQTQMGVKLLLNKSQYISLQFMSYNTIHPQQINYQRKNTLADLDNFRFKKALNEMNHNFDRLSCHYDRHINRTIINNICHIKKRRKSLLKQQKSKTNISERILLLNQDENSNSIRNIDESPQIRFHQASNLGQIFSNELSKVKHLQKQNRLKNSNNFSDQVIPFDQTPISHERVHTNTQTEFSKFRLKNEI
ncbi:UNKNOWN [Stylonychia lemnae]|uniref:Transmembrane protein n=1 Tax=Stylonychia lemnae TaxID=5949 RepID=A0A078APF6_STYLE|nr:UNKNOWN [Stylonychia lemnae]|eukprot:CDW83197.1 UNKNOWN [Stylonychia lemnae]